MKGPYFVRRAGIAPSDSKVIQVFTCEQFRQELLHRKVCAVSVASNYQQWFWEIETAGFGVQAYLRLVDCRIRGGKLHADAMAVLAHEREVFAHHPWNQAGE